MLGRLVVVGLVVCAIGAVARADDPRGAFDAARKQYDLGHFTEALAGFEKAYVARPDPPTLVLIGQCHRHLRRWEEAAHAFRRYLAAAPAAPDRAAVEKLALEAEAALRKVESGNLPDAQAKQRFDSGNTEYALGHWDAAIRHFEAGFKLSPKPQFLYNIAQAHRRAGRATAAIDFYRRYLELQPDAPDRAEVEGEIASARAEAAPKPAPAASPAAAPTPAPAVAAASSPPSAGTPVYKKAWLWGVVGGVVVAGGALGIGLALGLPKDASAPSGEAALKVPF